MIYSKTSEYAIRALMYFADHPQASCVTVKTLSRASGVPHAYVAKIFQCLTLGRIVSSQRGPSGGYSLLVPPDKLTLLQVVEVLDDVSQSPFSNCVMGLDKCNDRNPCPLHDIWKEAKERMRQKLKASTIADIAGLGRKFRSGRHRRSVLSKTMRNIFSV